MSMRSSRNIPSGCDAADRFSADPTGFLDGHSRTVKRHSVGSQEDPVMNARVGRTRKFVVALAISVLGGCSSDKATGPAALSITGSWSGTSGGQALSFTVEGGAIKGLKVFVPITSGNCGMSGVRTEYVATYSAGTVSGNSFTVRESGLTMSGTFSSNGSVSGTASLTQTSSSRGASCSGSGSTAWSATRQ